MKIEARKKTLRSPLKLRTLRREGRQKRCSTIQLIWRRQRLKNHPLITIRSIPKSLLLISQTRQTLSQVKLAENCSETPEPSQAFLGKWRGRKVFLQIMAIKEGGPEAKGNLLLNTRLCWKGGLKMEFEVQGNFDWWRTSQIKDLFSVSCNTVNSPKVLEKFIIPKLNSEVSEKIKH